MKTKPMFAIYNDKAVNCDHLPEKQRFHLACMRVLDNAKEGYVVDGERVYHLSPRSRLAKIVKNEDTRLRVLRMTGTDWLHDMTRPPPIADVDPNEED